MALLFFKMVVSLLFALSLFHKMFKRTVSTSVVLFLGFLWVVLDSFGLGDVGLWIVALGLLWLYWRGMQKPPTDKIVKR